ncbi:hypothetical protein TSOC_011917 [Tetrabaena socialis]|uniref:Uncharacterized protein n=1 Tax=Tetrabaena socialis TaxID=47790 RepID=A0A2J7ZPE1_9CHLO|nr:hypothetical protein TSOC_011917 [Tetrabaena socialis]|eukprot:PNH02130.1 hypothetical protein TSOC_011917 [Tetrabaena socialis]
MSDPYHGACGQAVGIMRLLAAPCPSRPQHMPARLYSRNLTPRQAARWTTLYFLRPGTEASNTAEGMVASHFLSGAARAEGVCVRKDRADPVVVYHEVSDSDGDDDEE